MYKMSIKEWESISDDFKGEWTQKTIDFRGDVPQCALGHRTWIPPLSLTKGNTELWTEGTSFIIEGREEYATDPFSKVIKAK